MTAELGEISAVPNLRTSAAFKVSKVGSTSSGRIAQSLREAILAGELPPGTRIRQEEVAARFGTSRLPVRDALRILEAEGLTTLKTNSGAWVSQLNLSECQAIYQVRERVEPLVLGYSIPHLTRRDHAELERLQSEMETVEDIEHRLDIDRQFHLMTYSACPVELLRSMTTRFWNTTQHYRRAYASITRGQRQWVVNAQHRLLIDAIKRGDVADAEALVAAHIRRTRVELETHPDMFEHGQVGYFTPATLLPN
jgi:DNA-binding GntR family transcriptional regulator